MYLCPIHLHSQHQQPTRKCYATQIVLFDSCVCARKVHKADMNCVLESIVFHSHSMSVSVGVVEFSFIVFSEGDIP